MGGGHQTRLCPDCARSNPAEGDADFPEARCHFFLNNSYEESNKQLHLCAVICIFASIPAIISCFFSFFLNFIPLLPILLSCFFDCCRTKLRCYDWNSSKSFNFMRCALCPGMFLDYEWRGRAPSGEILVMVFGRFGLECNMDRRRSHLMLRKHLAPRVIC